MDHGHTLMDTFLSKLKILIGFYQVTHGLLGVFSYISWPDPLKGVAKYSEVLQLNLLHIAPAHCLFPELRVNAFGDLFVILSINATAIGASGVFYGIRKRIILQNKSLEDEEKPAKLRDERSRVQKCLLCPLCDLPEYVFQDSQRFTTCLP